MSLFIASVLFVVSLIGMGASQVGADPLSIVGVLASSAQAPNVPANTIDGDLATRWSAQGDGQSIQYQLEECGVVSGVSIAFYQGDSRTASFSIETSEDGMAWLPAHSGDSSGLTLALQEVDIEDRVACFVRIVGFGTSVNDWNSITEVVIDGAEKNEVDPDKPIPVLAVIASADDGNVPANTIDGDLGTRWSAKGEQWIEFDLGEAAPMLNQVLIAWYQGDRRSSTFDIEVSTDGVEFTKIYGGYSSGTTLELQPYAFAAKAARYVRIVGFGNSRSDWNSITEVQFPQAD